MEQIGTIETSCRYPVKSMAGEQGMKPSSVTRMSWETVPTPLFPSVQR